MDTDVKINYLQYKSGGLHESDRSSFEKSVLLYSENTSGTWSFHFFVNSIPSILKFVLSEWSINWGDIISKKESILLFFWTDAKLVEYQVLLNSAVNIWK